MNIEIANRLLELRKKNGLSQDELAAKLGISRQSVSKWERAEASPDTDNLICLAKIYGVSLDELLSNDQTVEEISEEVKEQTEAKEAKEECPGHKFNPCEEKVENGWTAVGGILTGGLYLAYLVIYLVLGFTVAGFWAYGWPGFILPPAIGSIFTAIGRKKFTEFLLPVVCAYLYCQLGMSIDFWHPGWVIFFAIPVFYMVFGPIDTYFEKKRNN